MRATMEQMSAAEAEASPSWLIDNLAATDTEMFALTIEAWAQAESSWQLLPRITAPTLLIAGEMECQAGAARRAAARLPNGRAVVLRGYGHLQAFWHREVTGPLVAAFLREAEDSA